MRALLLSGVLVVLVMVLVGCPFFPENANFTSADVGGTGLNRFGAEGDGLASPAEDDAEGEGGQEERTVVEPDVIRRAGNLLYVLNQFRGLTIVDLDTETILSRVPAFGFPRDLYLDGDRAYLLVGYAQDVDVLDDDLIAIEVTSRLHVVDVADPANAAIEASFDIEGDLVDSRLVGDVLYAVTSEYMYYGFDGGVGGDVPEGDVPVSDRKQNSSSYVTSVLLDDPANARVADELEFTGAGHVIHVTPQNVFVATPDYAFGDTVITVVDISDPNGTLALTGTANAPGYIADRFKLDAWNGTLRVVSSVFQNRAEVYVTTIDLATLETLRSLRLEDASGDSLFATRFDGPLAYIVTYFVVDPLFVVDLADPANPIVRAPLEVPGFSTHIEPMGDRLIAMGVDDTGGQRRVAVSLFDVSGDPVRLANVSFGEDWAWSNAFSDVKAFTVLDDTVIVPFSGWAGEAGGYERLQFVSYTRDTLTLNDAVDLNGTILRSFEYGDEYFGVTTEQLARISGADLDDLDVTSTVTLAENVVDFVELGSDRGAEIIARYDDGLTEVRVVDGQLSTISTVIVDIENYGGAFAYDGGVVLYGTGYTYEPDYDGFYEIAVVAVDDDGIASVAGTTTADVEPYYGYYYGGSFIEPGIAIETDALFAPYPQPYDADRQAFLVGEHLVLRAFATDVDRTFGADPAQQALAVVNLESIEWTRTLGLGYAQIASIDQVGELLYLGTKVDLGNLIGPPLCAHYIQTLDPIAETSGVAANVPGTFVSYDPSSDLLVLRDFQWGDGSDLVNSIRTVTWAGTETVTDIDALDLPQHAGELFPANGNLFYSDYDNGFGIGRVVVDAAGGLSNGEGIRVSESYGQLLGADGDDAYVTLGGQAVARYEFSATPQLGAVVQVMGAPLRLVVGGDRAYAPLGYFGLVPLP